MNRPARADEELDVVLDGHRHLFPSELGPAVEAARMLGAELREIQISPEVAEQHIALALARARQTAVRARWRTVRRTAVAMVAAATLVVGPAALAAGAALPGEPLYPLKRSIEAADLAFAFSPASEARVHTHIAAACLSELHALFRKGRTKQLPAAMIALREAMIDANAAVARAMRAEGSTGATNAAADQLAAVRYDTLALLAQGGDLNVTPQLEELLNALPMPTVPPPAPVPSPTNPQAPATSATTGPTAPPTTAGGDVTSTSPPTTGSTTTQAPTTEPPTTVAPPPPTPADQPAQPAPDDQSQ